MKKIKEKDNYKYSNKYDHKIWKAITLLDLRTKYNKKAYLDIRYYL